MLQSSEAPYPNRRYRPTKLSRPAETMTTKEFRAKTEVAFPSYLKNESNIKHGVQTSCVRQQDVGTDTTPGCGGAANPRQTLLFKATYALQNELIKPDWESPPEPVRNTRNIPKNSASVHTPSRGTRAKAFNSPEIWPFEHFVKNTWPSAGKNLHASWLERPEIREGCRKSTWRQRSVIIHFLLVSTLACVLVDLTIRVSQHGQRRLVI